MIAATYARIIIVMLCGLLTVATSASAECAWVLWSELDVSSTSKANPQASFSDHALTPEDTYKSKEQCLAAVTKRLSYSPAGKGPGYETRVTPTGYVTFYDDDHGRRTLSQRWQCLPDTVDPRGPKGK